MKKLTPEIVLDPTWLCQANYVDLEYYTYVILAAKKKYLENLTSGFSNFYEIVFHYLNLNTVIADKKLYDSHLKVTRSHKNLMMIVTQLTHGSDTVGKGIVRMAASVFGEVMHEYLKKQIMFLENLEFHFNNRLIHKEEFVYLVRRTCDSDQYEIFRLSMNAVEPLGYRIDLMTKVNLPDLKHNEFGERLLKTHPHMVDFLPHRNVMLITETGLISREESVSLAKDTILLNRVRSSVHGFDANVMIDYNRLLEKRQAIPFTLKV
jgi:hypothetical protein